MKAKCSKIRCPVQYDTISNCSLSSNECQYFTPEIDYEKVYENICNHIADLVVKKLKEQQD